jgi:putative redox protein
MKVRTRYQGQRRFDSGEGVARVVMDAAADADGLGEAPTPKQMVLHGLAGCTGLDVAVMLERKKVRFEELEVEVEAEQTRAHPRVFKTILITYRVAADPADRAAIERAIQLSEERFCGVSAMLGKTAHIETALELRPLPGR